MARLEEGTWWEEAGVVIQALEDAWIAVRKESWMEAWRDV